MNRLIKIPLLALPVLVAAKLFWPHSAHHAPDNAKSTILDVAIEGAEQYQISMWVPFGSTSDSVPGIAHVLEHLKFKTDEGNGFTAFDAIPGSSSNASTTYLSTRYDLSVPAAGFSAALQTLAAMTKPLTITDDSLKLEKNIVIQELFQRTQSNPDSPFYQKFSTQLYKGFPFENPPIGTQEKIAGVSMTDVLAFDKAHYQGSPTFMSITGPALSGASRDAIETYFPNSALGFVSIGHKFVVTRDDAELKGVGAFLLKIAAPEIEPSTFTMEDFSERATSTKVSTSKIVAAPTAWHSIAAARILNDVMNSRLAEGLYDRVSENPRLVQNWSLNLSRPLEGLWQVDFGADLEPGVTPDQINKIADSYLVELTTKGISQQSFDRVKARYFLTNEWENVGARASNLANDSVDDGYDQAISYVDELQRVTLADVNELLKVTQLPGRVGISVLKPKGAL
jgi:predicted Zn-dependent peptidase